MMLLLLLITGTFSCPDGYYKCPGSFCLKERFVCDGEKHCEHGEDEINCGMHYFYMGLDATETKHKTEMLHIAIITILQSR